MNAPPKVDARPLAFGMWTFALPDTATLWLHWDGPGTGLYLASARSMNRIRHPSAGSTYQTRKQAQAAAGAFIAAGLADDDDAPGEPGRDHEEQR